MTGLTLSLIVGLNYAKEILKHYEKSFIPIHHMEAHALVARLVYPQVSVKFLFCSDSAVLRRGILLSYFQVCVILF